jgi:sugar lactone lactonase YvrE
MTSDDRDLRLLADGFTFLEVPRWRHDRLWLADMYARCVLSLTQDGSRATSITLPDEPAGLGWRDGRLLVALRNERRLVTAGAGGVSPVADLTELASAQLNDMSIDAAGRAYVGNFGIESGALIRVDPGGAIQRAADDLLLPNGSAITPDGATLIVAESAAQRLTAFAVTREGTLTRRRVWAAFGEPPRSRAMPALLGELTSWPDGIALDANGAVWVADAFANQVMRVREGG